MQLLLFVDIDEHFLSSILHKKDSSYNTDNLHFVLAEKSINEPYKMLEQFVRSIVITFGAHNNRQ